MLGGITSNNEEASELKVPYAILNTSQGSVSGNIKFMIPRAEEKKIAEWIAKIENKCNDISIETETKIFEGQSLPTRSSKSNVSQNTNFQITFGELMDYNAEPFSINFRPRVTDNLLICGHDDIIKKSLLDSVIESALESEYCEEVIYVGDVNDMIDTALGSKWIVFGQ